MFGITLHEMPIKPDRSSLTVNSIEVTPGDFRVTADINSGDEDHERICFGATTEDFGEKLAKLISTLPFDCTLRQSKSGNGTSRYYFD
ncbi:MAG: hypothetical protein AUJ07_10835 [Crenarchaeota archaeon 13_1_40CM_3_53_5]|nr:MAG: hypothetical protein AUJ07_10835 [Crenarchaeota archaeon 13_1_40CM_3_53_5]